MTFSIIENIKQIGFKTLVLWIGAFWVLGCAAGGPYHETPERPLTPGWEQTLGDGQ